MIALTPALHDLVVGTSDGIDVRFAGIEFKDPPSYVGASAGKRKGIYGGTEWDALWVYTPAPPAEAPTLRFEFSIGGELTEEYCEVRPISADG